MPRRGDTMSPGCSTGCAAAVRRYAEALRDLSVIRVAVNQDYVGRDHPIRDGDEIAIFPAGTRRSEVPSSREVSPGADASDLRRCGGRR